jgi:hypothetical protein
MEQDLINEFWWYYNNRFKLPYKVVQNKLDENLNKLMKIWRMG